MNQQVVIMGCIGFVAVWLAYHALCSAIRSLFRQQLYRLRDSLFIEAARGNISFSDPAYGMLRTMMQRTLMASQHFNLPQFLCAVVMAPRLRDGPMPLADKFASTLASMPDRDRAAVYDRYFRSMMLLVATHMIRTLPIPIFGALTVFILCRMPGSIWRTLLARIQASRASSASKYVETAYHLPEGLRLA